MALQAAVPAAAFPRTDGPSLPSSFLAASASGAPLESVAVGRHSFFGCSRRLRCSPPSTSSPVLQSRRLVTTTTTTAVIKRKKDYKLDSVIQGEKKLKRVLKLKELLVKQPGAVMSLRDLGKHRRYLGLTGKKRIIALLNMFPSVFQVYEEGSSAKYFRFTAEAKKQFLEEKRLHKEMEEVAVTKLRKLLMMSIDKSIAIQKIKHIRRELGLPDDFATSDFLSSHCQYFKLGTCGLGPLLILEEWDPELAVSALEKAAREKVNARLELELDLARSLGEEVEEEESVAARAPRFQKKVLNLPKGQQIKKKDKEKLLKFQELPAISPYGDKSDLNPSTAEAEKAAVLVVHELLSLTSEKKILVDHLTHFRRDFKFSQKIRAMLIRHPEYFYVSLKGTRDSVFLREAYENSELKEKDPLVLLKERMAELVAKGRRDEKLDDLSDDDDSEGEDEDAEDGDDEDWDEYDDEERFLGLVGKEFAHISREKVATAPRERW
ncbi:hypothetical protein KC19_7G189700 [Ceratodon purpureus]|uniref:PORR domain-containing protein n=1 Tax=Ceratodon purpureus TaxID=3225 RepID=A0A8T0HCV7_CERPU|nr:hypothetical protein KC19_7G189700 [Ceratodon purpureus]